ncbi:DinB family protein [Phytoactinopolyspora endophytica]|uniref:DinB family protein n=1 Tax=Phytoactinopolyspora endophytica TaxID=1642495 RepID=UPI00101C534C|nr:DinB family protein [Phytoactinopolyspora endophytica]
MAAARGRTTAGRRRDAPPPSTGATEKDVLVGFLDYLRTSVAAKVDGVSEPEVRAPGVPSGTSLLGLIKHLSHVEGRAFLGRHVRNWQDTFRPGPDETADGILADYRDTVVRANEVIAAWSDLAEPADSYGAGGSVPSRRWILTHMIEETGRHAGHADILRELIDGATGR